MYKPRPIFLTLFILLALLLAACGGGEEAAPPAPADQPAATATPLPATATPLPATATPLPATATPLPATATPLPATATPAGNFLTRLFKAEDVLNSYRSTSAITYLIKEEEGEPQEISIRTEAEWVRADNDRGFDIHMVMNGLEGIPGAEEAMDGMTLYIIDDTLYMYVDGQWASMPADQGDPDALNAFQVSPEEVIENFDNLKRVGSERVNGVATTHYTFTALRDLDSTAFQALMQGESLGEGVVDITSDGDLWVADDLGYPVKMILHATMTFAPAAGSDEPGGVLEMTIINEMYDINALIRIELPAGAPQPGQVQVPGFAAGEFPLPPGAQVQGNFGSMITLTVDLSQAEVEQFFTERLTALGWTKSGEFMPTWSKDGASFSLFITSAEGEGVNISIISQ